LAIALEPRLDPLEQLDGLGRAALARRQGIERSPGAREIAVIEGGPGLLQMPSRGLPRGFERTPELLGAAPRLRMRLEQRSEQLQSSSGLGLARELLGLGDLLSEASGLLIQPLCLDKAIDRSAERSPAEVLVRGTKQGIGLLDDRRQGLASLTGLRA